MEIKANKIDEIDKIDKKKFEKVVDIKNLLVEVVCSQLKIKSLPQYFQKGQQYFKSNKN